MSGTIWMLRATVVAALVGLGGSSTLAHDGPPFPIVSKAPSGPYEVSIWTDPDTTDDGTPGGQFWVTLKTAGGGDPPSTTRAELVIAPMERAGPEQRAVAAPIDGDASRQFAAVVMDHEGRFRVHVTIDGPLGPAEVRGEVAATYDLRPPPVLVLVYLVPFLLVGFLWLKLMLRRRTPPPAGR
jgi:hypothetical protein